MQGLLAHISSGEGVVRQVREEEFVDTTFPGDTDRFLLLFLPGLVSRMGRHHNPAQHALGPHPNRWTVVETPYHLALRALLELIRWQVQPCRTLRMIKQAILLAPSHKGEPCQLGEHRPQAIWPIKPQQGSFWWELLRCARAGDRDQVLAEVHALPSVPSGAEPTEPLERVRLANGGAGANDLPRLSPGVARRTHVVQSAQGWRQLFGLG